MNKKETALIAIIGFLAVSESEAGYFAEVGMASYNKPYGSLWQQEFAGYNTQWTMKTPAFRIGVEDKWIRFSYFDLGNYAIAGEAGHNEDAIVACDCRVGESATYMTQGSFRGFALSFRPSWKGLSLEVGPAMIRQSFRLNVDGGLEFRSREWVKGYLVGVGYDTERVSFGVTYYTPSNPATFSENGWDMPSGVNNAVVASLGFKF